MSINPKEIATLEKLRQDGRILASAWPKSLAQLLEQLTRAGVVSVSKPQGARVPYVMIKNKRAIDERIASVSFSGEMDTDSVRAQNIAANGASKSGGRLPYVSLLLVGGNSVGWETECGVPVSWPAPAHKSCLRMLNIDERYPDDLLQPLGDVILVENKDLAINLPEILPPELQGALIVHYEGWLSDRLICTIKRWRYAKLWVLPDLDPVGFANIKRLRTQIPDVGVLIPDLSADDIRLFGNGSIWKDNFGLVENLLPWIRTQDQALQNIFVKLHESSVGIEQEAFLVMGKAITWNINR